MNTHRLPIEHADYRYPPSKNPYWTKLGEFKDRVYSDSETEEHASHWRSEFRQVLNPEGRRLHVEIGCNAGHVITEWADRNKDDLYIGIDWKFKIIYKAAEKANKRDLKNLLFFRAHAERLRYMFGPREIDFLYLYFPDPWPKKSQQKNRFVQADALRAISKLVKPNGIFHIKTDHPGYFQWMKEVIEESRDSWKVLEITDNLHAGHPAPHLLQIPEVTLFERLFIRDQMPIHSVKLMPV